MKKLWRWITSWWRPKPQYTQIEWQVDLVVICGKGAARIWGIETSEEEVERMKGIEPL